MSERRIERALARLASPGALLAADHDSGDFGVYPRGDRRRRPVVRLSAGEVRALEADGAIEAHGGGAFALSAAGAARVARAGAPLAEQFLAQHGAVVDRSVLDRDGDVRAVRGLDAEAPMRRLARLRDAAGGPWLSEGELAAASRLRADWELAEIGLVRTSDWTAAPIGSSARGAPDAQERSMARRCDARRRMADALARLAPPLRRVVERVCLHEEGLETLERAEGWPARSGKLALKLGLAQLAEAMGSGQ
jgi:hypothetical protein